MMLKKISHSLLVLALLAALTAGEGAVQGD
jgi:hypothetical protein